MLITRQCANGNHNGCLHDMGHMPSLGARLICECPCHDRRGKQPPTPPTKRAKPESEAGR